MKKLISIILTMCIISSLFCISVFAEEAQGEIISYFLDKDNKILLTYNTVTKVLEVTGEGETPDCISSHYEVFQDYEDEEIIKAETLIIGEGITAIGEQAFADFSSLKTVVFPDSLKKVSKLAFFYCSSLESVTGNNVEIIEGGAFKECYSLRKATFPKLTKLNNNLVHGYAPLFYYWRYPKQEFYVGAFQECKSLQEVNIPSIQEIGPKSFYGCSDLEYINKLYIYQNDENGFIKKFISNLDSVTYLGHSAFYNCDSLERISLKNIKTLSSAKTKVDVPLPQNKKQMAPRPYEGTFEGCTYMKECYIPNIKYIGPRTFYGCNYLEEMCTNNKLNKLTYLGEAAFGNCQRLKNISLPKVTKLAMSKWYEYDDPSTFDLLFIFEDDEEDDIEHEKITDLMYCGTFEGCTSLNSISVPSATKIGARAFYNCSSLKSISAPKADYLGASAFSNCTKLNTAYLPNLKEIKNSNWYIYKHKSSYEIGAFENCSNLKKVTISNVLKIGKRAFVNCKNLIGINMKNTEIIGEKAFYNCNGLKSISIPQKVKSIQIRAFMNCKNLKTINIRTKILSGVKEYAFSNIYKKAVFNCPKKQLAKYKKLIKSKAPKTAVFRGVY